MSSVTVTVWGLGLRIVVLELYSLMRAVPSEKPPKETWGKQHRETVVTIQEINVEENPSQSRVQRSPPTEMLPGDITVGLARLNGHSESQRYCL